MTSFRENSSNGLINKDIENGDFLSKRKLERKKYHADLFALGQEIMRCINGNNIEEAKKKFDEFTIKISPEIKLNLNLYIKRIRDDKYKEFGNIGTHIDYESCLDESLQEYYLYLWKYRDKRFDRLFNQDFPSNITRLILNDTKRIFVNNIHKLHNRIKQTKNTPIGDIIDQQPQPGEISAIESLELIIALVKEKLGEMKDGIFSYRNIEIIKMRFGLGDDGRAYTLKEIGEKFEISSERVRQIEVLVLKKMKLNQALIKTYEEYF